MFKRASVDPQGDGDSDAGGAANAPSEGKTKAVKSMFDSMVPIMPGAKKDSDDEDVSEEGGSGKKKKKKSKAKPKGQAKPNAAAAKAWGIKC